MYNYSKEFQEKVSELCSLIPGLQREINWAKGKTLEGKDQCVYKFKNGSYFDNLAARESSRGKRRHGCIIEECVGVDGKILSEVIIPRYRGHNNENYYCKRRERMVKRCPRNWANGELHRIPCQAAQAEGVETNPDECKGVGPMQPRIEARRNYLNNIK